MPTPYSRVQVVMIPPVEKAIRRISAVTGQTLGSIVREMLEEAAPQLEKLADALELVPKSTGAALLKMQQSLDEVTADAQQMSLDIGVQRETLAKQVVKTAKRRKKAASR